MAAVTYLGGLGAGSLTTGGPFTTAAFTPPAGSLIVCVIGYSVTPMATPPTNEVVTSSAGLTFTAAGIAATENTGGFRLRAWVANQVATAVSQTFTITLTGAGAPEGCHLGVYAITGMSRLGLDAVKQYGAQNSIIVNLARTITFPAACLTTNPVFAAISGENGGVTYPINDAGGNWFPPAQGVSGNPWTLGLNSTFTKPTQRAASYARSSGYTGNYVTALGTNTDRCFIAFELDSSAAVPLGPQATLGTTEEPDTTTAGNAVLSWADRTATLAVGEVSDFGTTEVDVAARATHNVGEVSDTSTTSTAKSFVAANLPPYLETGDAIAANALAPPGGTLDYLENADTITAGTAIASPNPTLNVGEVSDEITAGNVVTEFKASTNITETGDVVSATAQSILIVGIQSLLSYTEEPDVLSTSTTVSNVVTLAKGELSDIASAVNTTATALTKATYAITENSDTCTGIGKVFISVTHNVTEDSDTLTATAGVGAVIQQSASLAYSEDADIGGGTAAATAGITLEYTENADTGTANALAPIRATVDVTEVSDSVVGTVVAIPALHATLAATEAPDTLDAQTGVITTYTIAFEFGPSVDTTSGTFALKLNPINSTASYAVHGTTAANAVDFSTPGTSAVVTGIADLAAPFIVGRYNGAEVGASNTDLGDGNFGSHPLYIGFAADGSKGTSGRLYQLILRGAPSTEQEVADIENYVADKTGVVLPESLMVGMTSFYYKPRWRQHVGRAVWLMALVLAVCLI